MQCSKKDWRDLLIPHDLVKAGSAEPVSTGCHLYRVSQQSVAGWTHQAHQLCFFQLNAIVVDYRVQSFHHEITLHTRPQCFDTHSVVTEMFNGFGLSSCYFAILCLNVLEIFRYFRL